jgi:hypothetical protein
MIPFKVLGKKYDLPTCWDDVTYTQSLFHIYPRTLAETISCFTGIPKDTLLTSELKGLEKINIALSFMNLAPAYNRTQVVNGIPLPTDPTIESLGQFEDLRNLLNKMPKKETKDFEYQDWEIYHSLCLEACAIYMQKVIDGKYDFTKVSKVKEDLKTASCLEVIGTGAFFLFRPLNISPPSMNPFLTLIHRLKRLIQGLPGYQKTLAFLLHSRT